MARVLGPPHERVGKLLQARWRLACLCGCPPGPCGLRCSGPFCLVFLDQGYLFISVLVNSNSELIRLINNAIKNDLASRNPTFMGLALHCIANVGSREMGEAFAADIPRILVAG